MSSSCSAQVHAITSACPELVKCVCSDRSIIDCAMTYNTPACTQAGQAIGACQHQSCAAQCTPPKSAGGTTTAAPALPAAPPGEDSCAALTACCPRMPAAMQPSCTSMASMKNPAQCAQMLAAMRAGRVCN